MYQIFRWKSATKFDCKQFKYCIFFQHRYIGGYIRCFIRLYSNWAHWINDYNTISTVFFRKFSYWKLIRIGTHSAIQTPVTKEKNISKLVQHSVLILIQKLLLTNTLVIKPKEIVITERTNVTFKILTIFLLSIHKSNTILFCFKKSLYLQNKYY